MWAQIRAAFLARPAIHRGFEEVSDALEAIRWPQLEPRLFRRWQDAVDEGVWHAERWPNFSAPELACNCGGRFCDGEYFHDPDFLDQLQAMRRKLNRPLIITSGHRCARWNAAVGGAPRSQHKRIAADIHLRGHDPIMLFRAAREVGLGGLGFASSFFHVDPRTSPAVWGYGALARDVWQKFGVVFDDTGRRILTLPKGADHGSD